MENQLPRFGFRGLDSVMESAESVERGTMTNLDFLLPLHLLLAVKNDLRRVLRSRSKTALREFAAAVADATDAICGRMNETRKAAGDSGGKAVAG